MRMLRPKNINRLCVALVLIAPLVYLFGTQFMALAGAHGADILSDGSAVYRDSLFNSMFGSENFLTHIGEVALSQNPVGFAPFGLFLSYLDTNLLHISGYSLGLMAYGYCYYCAHVLLFDLVIYFMVFFIRLIKSIVDRWEVR